MFIQYLIESLTSSQLSSLSAEDLNKHLQDRIGHRESINKGELDSILSNKNLSSDHLLTLTQNLHLMPSRASHHALFAKVMTSEKNPTLLNQHAYAFLQSPHLSTDQHLKEISKGIKTGNPSMPIDNKLKDRILLMADNPKKMKETLATHEQNVFSTPSGLENKFLFMNKGL